ncbi:hypothetical protein [Microcoleus vaginatus]|uniref:hypothetical protein n=1 Tax=Microcoleus vaginatus TaxID=119532 RepID=UPI001F61C8F5|nr:hypothetical protein D0A37_11740 [Microcoleus vaginatus HSN003]
MTTAVLLRSGMMGNYHVPFWRAVEGATPSLTLIILVKGFKLLAEYLNSTVGHTESGAKSSKAQGETNLWLKNGDEESSKLAR